jgi:carbon monoxide dehydrogenase subunit G
MTFSQTCTIPAGRERLWDFLMDVPRVTQCLPGVEKVEAVGQESYRGTFKVKVGPISLALEGNVTVEERRREAWQAALRAEATDRRLGGGIRARARMTLAPAGDGATALTVETDLTVLGKIGEFGQPVIKKKADALLQEFATNIRTALSL